MVKVLVGELSLPLFYIVYPVQNDRGPALVCWLNDNVFVGGKVFDGLFLRSSDIVKFRGCGKGFSEVPFVGEYVRL